MKNDSNVKILSMLLALMMVVLPINVVFADYANVSTSTLNEMVGQETSVLFKSLSDSEIVYTYEKDGKTYKNIDKIILPNTVSTTVYLVNNNEEVYINSFVSIVSGTNIEKIFDNGVVEHDTLMTSNSGHSWVYKSSYDGDTSFRNTAITVIAMVIAGKIGGDYGLYLGIAAYLFDKNFDTVYYHVDVYKDTNSPKLRPIFKKVSYFYEDSSHSVEIPGNPVTSIIKP